MSESDFLWSLFTELRKELLESQKIRAQVLGFKFTFVSTAVGLIVADLDGLNGLDPALLVVPAIASMCFDLIIYSYGFSIKRIGTYCREYIEPAIGDRLELPSEFVFWQRFLQDPKTRQRLSTWGNLGFTLLVVLVGLVGLHVNGQIELQIGLGSFLVIFFLSNAFLAFFYPWRLGKVWKPVEKNITCHAIPVTQVKGDRPSKVRTD